MIETEVAVSDEAERAELEEVRLERDLYLRLLETGSQTQVEPFLEKALSLIVEVSGARQGFLELHDPEAGDDEPGWSIARGLSDAEVEGVRAHISRGIIAEALSSGRIVDTPSAMLDPRFGSRASVRAAHIEAVLCVPIGSDPPRGALYLQGRGERGPFSARDRARCEVFARHLAPLADNLLLRRRTEQAEDPTHELRSRLALDGVVGRSPALAAVLQEVALVAPLDVSVLLTGDSGTGKSQIARIIHDNGPRASHALVELNCAALPEALLESELFGALPGSHSTATRRIPGKLEAAEGGTLFLDEVGELAATAQSKLLQLLQSREYYPLGAAHPSRADVRVIAATNADLETAVAEGRFREDLFYRLQVLPVRVPTLRERRSDVPWLARHFAERACERHGLPRVELSSGALRAVEAAEWPGNVRQLEHAIEAAVIRATGQGGSQVDRRDVFPKAAAADPDAGEGASFQEATRDFQRELLSRTLEEHGWNVAAAARHLDLARSHVYNLIRAFGLERSTG
jgi:Nif-specific regulatory protein